MARLAFCDYHNMIAILENSEHNVDFHQIVDFVEASQIRIETTNEGTKILATVDGFNEFSSNIATAVVCLASNRVYNFSKMLFDGMSKAHPTTADEPASLLRDDSQGEAFPTVSSLEAGHDWENIIKTSALPHDSTPRGRSLETGEEACVERNVNVPPAVEVSTVSVPTRSDLVPNHLQDYEQSEAELTIGEKIDLINELVEYQDHHAMILKY
nr:hypothetical protein [Tanacetum cinerariifolium]